ncbi:MAG: hypothetical protein K0R65_192 [Crocinitomicaceae bacterium]|jgi:hypothetical protein|nr:hypothetical protein [Crocinitomicaceae bacterium]
MKTYIILIALFCFTLLSCRKEAGEGGKASINGLVWLKEYNGNFGSLLLERAAYDEYVYIQYGDEINYSDRVKTNHEGRFEFKYLRPGKYKVYFYSKDPEDKDNINPEEMMVVMQDVEITEKKQVISLDTLVIYD